MAPFTDDAEVLVKLTPGCWAPVELNAHWYRQEEEECHPAHVFVVCVIRRGCGEGGVLWKGDIFQTFFLLDSVLLKSDVVFTHVADICKQFCSANFEVKVCLVYFTSTAHRKLGNAMSSNVWNNQISLECVPVTHKNPFTSVLKYFFVNRNIIANAEAILKCSTSTISH